MQTYKDITVIIVDDCSHDNPLSIIEMFNKLLNIKYIKLDKNFGSGYARKIGIENASSEYLVFADSDDTFLTAFSIEKMVNCIESDSYDFASFGYVQEHENIEFSSVPCNATWIFSRIYSKNFLDKYSITFDSERFNEDVQFSQKCFSLAEKIYKSNETLYLHHMNENSVTKTSLYKSDDMNSFTRNYLKAYEFVKSKKQLTNKIKWQYLDGFIIMYHFYTEAIRTKDHEYCNSFLCLIHAYYNEIFDFAHELICSDDFSDHYFKILNSHGIHNKNLICTLDWYTFINECENARKMES